MNQIVRDGFDPPMGPLAEYRSAQRGKAEGRSRSRNEPTFMLTGGFCLHYLEAAIGWLFAQQPGWTGRDPSLRRRSRELQMKVFGIGCPRTGTTTLGDCFTILGFNGTSFNELLFHQVLEGNVRGSIEHAEDFDAFDDLPWCFLYRELDYAFPGSKFILTVRRNTRVWLKSYRRHHAMEHDALLTADGARASYRTHEYPIWPAGAKGYEEHNAAVMSYFRDRPESLLTVCWERGAGWNELAEFLGGPVPDVPFPHSNRSRAGYATVKSVLLHMRRLPRLHRFV